MALLYLQMVISANFSRILAFLGENQKVQLGFSVLFSAMYHSLGSNQIGQISADWLHVRQHWYHHYFVLFPSRNILWTNNSLKT